MAEVANITELDWSPPFNIDGVPCQTAPHEGGWLIVSTKSPRFCFAGDTKDRAIGIAERGIRFWRSH